jgi:3-hydroxyacyl-CoA dehydrogenase
LIEYLKKLAPKLPESGMPIRDVIKRVTESCRTFKPHPELPRKAVEQLIAEKYIEKKNGRIFYCYQRPPCDIDMSLFNQNTLMQ